MGVVSFRGLRESSETVYRLLPDFRQRRQVPALRLDERRPRGMAHSRAGRPFTRRSAPQRRTRSPWHAFCFRPRSGMLG
jgi:hypothetical protein